MSTHVIVLIPRVQGAGKIYGASSGLQATPGVAWAIAKGAAASGNGTQYGTGGITVTANGTPEYSASITRGVALFETNGVIPAGATILSAHLDGVSHGGGSVGNSCGGIYVVPATGLDWTGGAAPPLSDYAKILANFNTYGAIGTVSWDAVDGGVSTIDIDPSVINRSGNTRVAFISWKDADNDTPAFPAGTTEFSTLSLSYYPAGAANSLHIIYVNTPTVTTEAATNIIQAGATFNGTLTEDGEEACQCYYEYGLTVAYGSTTTPIGRTTGQTFPTVVTEPFRNGWTYHFRSVAVHSMTTVYGVDRTFVGVTIENPSVTTGTAVVT